MKPELYEEIQLVRSVPTADLKVGDRAILIDYLEHPSGGEMGAVLELSQSMGRKHYVVTVPVGAILRSLAKPIAALDSVTKSRSLRKNVPMWLSICQRILNVFGKFVTFSGLGKKDI